MTDLISIIIPTYNGERYLKECIASIHNQDIPNEIIVVDDVSTDNTVCIAKSMGCKVIVNKTHKGQVAGKNTGIREAKGNYILTIDQDDKLCPDALKILYGEMQKFATNMIVMAKLQDFCSPDTPEAKKYVKKDPFRGILTGSTLFRKEVFDIIGYFREDIITGDVIDLTTRLKNTGISITFLDYISCDRRIHNHNFGRINSNREYQDYVKCLRERLKNNGVLRHCLTR